MRKSQLLQQALLTLSLTLFLFTSICTAQSKRTLMNNTTIKKVLVEQVGELEGEKGSWYFLYNDRVLMVVTDEELNRIRIFTPVTEDDNLSDDNMRKMLEANFHSALDAKYSIFEGFVISVYTHPMTDMSQAQLLDAVQQVYVLASNYGDSYASTTLTEETMTSQDEANNVPSTEKRINEKPRKY